MPKGFYSTFVLKCEICSVTYFVSTENRYEKCSDINLNATAAIISTGGGYSALAEFSLAINLPISKKNYERKEDELMSKFFENTLESMLQAGRKEYK